MPYSCLIFDLDGTLSDPKEGICKSLRYSLEQHGYPSPSNEVLSTYIGPPLDATFAALTASQEPALIKALVEKYRERYATQGYAENVLYEGIVEALDNFAKANIRLGICTSKRTDFAEQILKLFSIRHYFSFVNGGDIGVEKSQQLRSLLDAGLIDSDAIMIGDRDVDIVAAHNNNLASAAVLWGYGSQTELEGASPRFVFAKPSELSLLL